MTDFATFRSRTRDLQDQNERGVWGVRQEVPGAGAMMSVRGTETLDEELPIMNFGYSFNLAANSNAEVIMMSLGSDVDAKVAIPTLPRDIQHQWAEGTGGVQSPTDPERRLEYNDNETWLKDGNYKLGNNKEVEVTVDGGTVTINITGGANINSSGDMVISAPSVEITSAALTHNGTNVGDTHVHGGVESGPSNTTGPQ
jgi:hypothetical protein